MVVVSPVEVFESLNNCDHLPSLKLYRRPRTEEYKHVSSDQARRPRSTRPCTANVSRERMDRVWGRWQRGGSVIVVPSAYHSGEYRTHLGWARDCLGCISTFPALSFHCLQSLRLHRHSLLATLPRSPSASPPHTETQTHTAATASAFPLFYFRYGAARHTDP